MLRRNIKGSLLYRETASFAYFVLQSLATNCPALRRQRLNRREGQLIANSIDQQMLAIEDLAL